MFRTDTDPVFNIGSVSHKPIFAKPQKDGRDTDPTENKQRKRKRIIDFKARRNWNETTCVYLIPASILRR